MKKRKILKKIGLSILACFMFCMPVLSAACTPLLALPENETPPVLALDPENDPTVFTTQSGLEIKKSNGYISSSVSTTTNNNKTHTQDLSGFYYFTMGTFSGTIYTGVSGSRTASYSVTNEPVNWLIIGRGEFEFYDDTPAGSDIQNDANDQEIAMLRCYLPLSMSSIPENDEIPKNSFLVLSEKLLGQMYFNCTGAINYGCLVYHDASNLLHSTGNFGNRYRYYGKTNTTTAGGQSWTTSGNPGGSLYNYINNLFSKNNSTGAIVSNSLGFSDIEADMILPQQLYTYYSNGGSYHYQETPETDGGTYYSLFPLAYRAAYSSIYQNFCVEDYLSSNPQRTSILLGSSSNQSYVWWLRSGSPSYCARASVVYPSGQFEVVVSDGFYSNGVRPAMVIKIM